MVSAASPVSILAGAIVLGALIVMAQGVEESTGIEATPGQVRVGLAAVGAEAWLVAGAVAIATAALAPISPAGRGIAAVFMASVVLALASGSASPTVA